MVTCGPFRRKRRLRRHEFSKRRLNHVIRRVKQAARPEISKISGGWTYHNYAKFPLYKLSAEEPGAIERVDARRLSVNEFRNRFERGVGKPIILRHTQDAWLAKERWTISRMAEKYRNQLFKVGEDDDGNSVKLKFKYYVDYMTKTSDDSPLYIFDSRFGEQRRKKKLLEDYEIPTFFQDDLLRYSGERKRPPYRWIVIGPKRSGTGIHIDPMATSAWNGLVVGHKRWVLFPPATPKEMVKLRKSEGWRNRSEAATWFENVYPRTLRDDWPKEFKPVNFVQNPGETVFVPSGWWHVVVNLDTTIAVTQNFASPANFPQVFAHAARSRPILARKWLKALKCVRPELAEIAEKIYADPKAATNSFVSGYHSESSSSSSSSSESYASSFDSSSDSSWTSGSTATSSSSSSSSFSSRRKKHSSSSRYSSTSSSSGSSGSRSTASSRS